jgi:hypothetical protein
MKKAPGTATWEPLREMEWLVDADGTRRPIPAQFRVLKNNRYQVMVTEQKAPDPWAKVTWLSIKRLDRAPVHDWRDLQRLKNEIVGPEVEAVELYPAESRLVDTSNQYALFCFTNGLRLPFGYTQRLVMEHDPNDPHPLFRKAVQRPWPKEDRPADVLTPALARLKYGGGLDDDGS